MNKYLQVIIYLLCSVCLRAHQPEPFALFTIPKSGSHLLIKTLHLLTGFSPSWHTDAPAVDQLYADHFFPYTHICLSSDLTGFYANSPAKQIVGIRDLRDVCVSIVYQIQKGTWPEFTNHKKKRKEFSKLSFDEQLLFVINQEYEIRPPAVSLQLGIRKVAEQAVSLSKNPAILLCRFEDLVGAKGGGSDELQKETVGRIAKHLGISLSESELGNITSSLYGDEVNPFGSGAFSHYQSTFREGKIGGWKTLFKKQHKAAFKKRLGKALIDLGYEKDLNW